MKLYYEETGQGQPMVLLHGNGEDGSYFKSQVEYFSKNYRVITLDTRGHGKSERGEAPFSIRQFAGDLKKFLDEKKLTKIILLGFSDGGNIALIFAIRYPQYIDKLILNGANLTPWGMKTKIHAKIAVAYMKSILRIQIGERKERRRRLNDSEKERLSRARKRKELLGLMVHEPRLSAFYFRYFRVPTLVIAGTKDMIRTSHTKKIHCLIPGSRLCLIEGTHFIASENSLEFNQEVERFLSGGGRE